VGEDGGRVAPWEGSLLTAGQLGSGLVGQWIGSSGVSATIAVHEDHRGP
jgi:hypothetical protein